MSGCSDDRVISMPVRTPGPSRQRVVLHAERQQCNAGRKTLLHRLARDSHHQHCTPAYRPLPDAQTPGTSIAHTDPNRVIVPVEMIRRNIQEHRNPRTERLHMVQLETAHFQDHGGMCSATIPPTTSENAVSMLPATTTGDPGIFKHPPAQRGCGGLAVGPRDRHHRPRAEPACDFKFAHHLHTAVDRLPAQSGASTARRDSARACPRRWTRGCVRRIHRESSPAPAQPAQPPPSSRGRGYHSQTPALPAAEQARHRDAAARSADHRKPCSRRSASRSTLSPYLECRQTDNHQQNRNDVEPRDNLRLRPAEQFKVMMQRSHPEDAAVLRRTSASCT